MINLKIKNVNIIFTTLIIFIGGRKNLCFLTRTFTAKKPKIRHGGSRFAKSFKNFPKSY